MTKTIVLRVSCHSRDQVRTHAPARIGIERRERLVHQNDAGIDGKGARDRDPLALAARQHGRKLVDVAPEPHHLQELGRPLMALALADGGRAQLDGEADIVARVAPGHEARRLEDIGERAAGELWGAPANADEALGRLDQAADDADHRRLAAAARSQQAGELALGDREREAGEDAVGAKLHRDIAQFDVRFAGLGRATSCPRRTSAALRSSIVISYSSGRDVGCRAPILPLEARKREQRKHGSAHGARPGGEDAVESRPSLRVLDERALLRLPSLQRQRNVGGFLQMHRQAEASHHGAAAALAEIWRHGVRRIADDGNAAGRPPLELDLT